LVRAALPHHIALGLQHASGAWLTLLGEDSREMCPRKYGEARLPVQRAHDGQHVPLVLSSRGARHPGQVLAALRALLGAHPRRAHGR
jgi:hypothetical protein